MAGAGPRVVQFLLFLGRWVFAGEALLTLPVEQPEMLEWLGLVMETAWEMELSLKQAAPVLQRGCWICLTKHWCVSK